MAVLDEVMDPEIPVVSITDLGIVRGFADDPPRVRITPTYTGCPATIAIERAVRDALDKAGFDHVGSRAGAVPALDHGLDQRARPPAAAQLRHRRRRTPSCRRNARNADPAIRSRSAASARRRARRSGAATPAWSRSTASSVTSEQGQKREARQPVLAHIIAGDIRHCRFEMRLGRVVGELRLLAAEAAQGLASTRRG